ncbi:MAG TPA: hypothetical protein VHO03_01245 [Ignavibacteriales bacterium]|nr:hypothetical protein [Ignavibacteriales bacterium]
MSKYSTNTSYIYYPGTDIPINFKDIKDKEILDETDRTLLFASYMKFNKKLNSKTIFDQNFIIKLHKETFGKLYPFAGRYRNKNVTKGEINFCFAINIQSEMDRLFNELKEEGYLKKRQ